MSKPSAGVCGSCGCAVVRPLPVEGHGWCRPVGAEDRASDWRDRVNWGHLYENGHLKKVRCEPCAYIDRQASRR